MADPTNTALPTDADRRALARCWECWEATDIGRPMLKRLSEIGWLKRTGMDRWQVTDEGDAILTEMGVS